MDHRIRMLTNHEIVVTDEAQLIGALDFLLQKREYFHNLYIFDDRVNYLVYSETTDLSETNFDCLKMINKLKYTGSVSLDFTLSQPYDKPMYYFSEIKLSAQQKDIKKVRECFPQIVKNLIVPIKFIEKANLGGWKRVSISVMDEEDLKALENESVKQKIEENQEEIEVKTGYWESIGIVEIIVDSQLFDKVKILEAQSDFPLPEYLTIRYTNAQEPILHI